MSHKALFFLTLLMSSLTAAADLGQAKELAASGDLPGALDAYMAVLAEEPGNPEALEAAAVVAGDMGISEMAADFLVQRVELAVANGDKATVARLNDSISQLYDQSPAWVAEKSAAVGAFSDELAGALATIDEMSQEVEQALIARMKARE